MYKIKEIIAVLEEMAPLAYAEVLITGLLVGDQEAIATAVLVCHDTRKCNRGNNC
jgi:putative NIF3 family GTP cyclohydrolase 1 type 2